MHTGSIVIYRTRLSATVAHMSIRHRAKSADSRRRPRRGRSTLLGVAIAIVTAAAALTGCDDPEPTATTDPAELVDKTFVSTESSNRTIPGGGPLVLRFTKGNLSANAGCNGHGGTVAFDGDKMTAGRLMGTMMACSPPRDGVDGWVTELFSAPLTWRLTGTELVLTRGEQKVVLQEQQNRPVVGTRWQVTSIVKQEAQSSSVLLQKLKPYFRIAPDGSLTGDTGCNSMTGSAKVDGDDVDFSPIATTRKACDAETTAIEQAILTALRDKTTVKVDGDDMTLRNVADGNVELRLTAVGN